MHPLRIADAADALGISAKTLRRYERAGIIPTPARDRNGWRIFSPDEVREIARVLYPGSAQERRP